MAVSLSRAAVRTRGSHHPRFAGPDQEETQFRCAVSGRDLVRELIEARDELTLSRLHQRYLRVALLVVDELGFVPFERTGGELLFNLLADRYERRSTIVTTNLRSASGYGCSATRSSPRRCSTASATTPTSSPRAVRPTARGTGPATELGWTGVVCITTPFSEVRHAPAGLDTEPTLLGARGRGRFVWMPKACCGRRPAGGGVLSMRREEVPAVF